MLNLLGKLVGKTISAGRKAEVKCNCCGETVFSVGEENSNIYICQNCNKLIYYVDPALLDDKVTPLSLGWLKKKPK